MICMMVGKEGTQMFQNKSFCTHQVLLGGGHVIVPELIEDFMVSLRSQVNEPCQAEFARIDQAGGGEGTRAIGEGVNMQIF